MPTRLVDQLRRFTDAQLTELLAARPDLAVPVPGDLPALAARISSRLSLARALEGLDRFTLEILDGVRLAADGSDHTTLTEIQKLAAQAPATRVRDAVDRLRALVVCYGPDDDLHVTRGVGELCSPYPAGLGRPAAELDPSAGALMADAARLRRELLSAPSAARAVLDRLAAGPPVGTTRDSVLPGSDESPDGPIAWLIHHHLLVPERVDTVQLPRELGLLLRRDSGPLGELHPDPPHIEAPNRAQDAVDGAGAGQVMETVRLTAALLDALATEPALVLKAGGLGVRDLRRLARSVDATEPVVALLLEVARETDLLTDDAPARSTTARSDAASDGAVWLPTPQYDTWRAAAPSVAWLDLARGWLTMARMPGLTGNRDDKNRVINALSGETARMSAPVLRAAALTTIAGLPAGSAPDVEDLVGLLSWHTPRRGGPQAAQAARWVFAEAAVLGLTGRGALTGYGRVLLARRADAADRDPLGARARIDEPGPEELLDELLPAPVDRVLLQADLTIVVPGPPEATLAAELDLLGDPESAGHATVYRVTPESVRRALDAGMSASDLHSLLARRSSTPVPQALSYLVDDVARRHGGLRVGTCSSYLRSEDTALVAELLADRRLGMLGLRQLAPTVLVSPYQVHRLLDTLRDAGYAPVAEDAGGVVLAQRPQLHRGAPASRIRRTPRELPDRLSAEQLATVVAALRRGEEAARTTRRPTSVGGANTTADALAVLQQAIRERQRIWVGYVDAHGGTASRLVRPVSIGGGFLRAADDRSETLHTFALHRITSAHPAEV